MKRYDVDRIVLALVEEGQDNSEKYGFNLGKVMRFTPMQVGTILSDLDIEPERKTGRWIFIRPTKEDRLYVACDQCGQVEAWDENCGMLCALLGEKYAHYCPNCGAYMGGNT